MKGYFKIIVAIFIGIVIIFLPRPSISREMDSNVNQVIILDKKISEYYGSNLLLAQNKIIPQSLLSRNPAEYKKNDDLSVFVSVAINVGVYLFGFIGALALLVFVYGGVMLIISQGSQEKIKQGTNAMTAAIIGLVISFSAYALISFLSTSVGVTKEKSLNLKNNNSHIAKSV